jgi:hypothetical protein
MASARGGGTSVRKRAAQSASVGGTTTECLAGMGDRARLPWALAIWPVGCGPLKPGGLHYSNGPTQFPIISNYIKLAKYESCTFCSPKFS